MIRGEIRAPTITQLPKGGKKSANLAKYNFSRHPKVVLFHWRIPSRKVNDHEAVLT